MLGLEPGASGELMSLAWWAYYVRAAQQQIKRENGEGSSRRGR